MTVASIPQKIYDIFDEFGNDMIYTSLYDLQTVSDTTRSQQRVLRRLLTNPGDYIWQPTYGAGLAKFVGQPLTQDLQKTIEGVIKSQIFLEDTVSKTPAPQIFLQTIQNSLYCQINYTENQSKTNIVITFTVSP